MWKLKIAEDGPYLATVNDHVGRQHWEFDPDAGTQEERAHVEALRESFTHNRFHNKQSADLLMRLQLLKENEVVKRSIPKGVELVKETTEEIREEAVRCTVRRALSLFSCLQAHDGHWPAESAGPLFFLPPLVMALYVTGDINVILSKEHQKEITRYLYNHQNEDGGWGLHIEGHSTMFGSGLSYIALRLLGEGLEENNNMAMATARNWILTHGSLQAIPSWGKFWLSVLGLYDWAGCNPLPPELWLLPDIFPIHPGKMLCYCRLVYMPMCYLYGKRFVGKITEMIKELRQELYNEPYSRINWNKARNIVAKEDLYYPHPLVQDLTWGFLHYVCEPLLTRWPFSKVIREKALEVVIKHIHYENENSRYLCIGCIEKAMCLVACWVHDPNSDAYKRHLARLPDYYWIAEDGLKIQSFGSQTWDAAFAIQAIIATNLGHEYGPTLRKAHDFLKASQVRENPSGNFSAMYRHISKGGWTFSMQDHGWQVSDCTAEGLKCAILLSQLPSSLVGEKLEKERLHDAVNVILSLQSSNGGFSAWEPQRAFRWLEKLNPTEFFEDTVIETEHVECTASAVHGLALFRALEPDHRRAEIDSCIFRAVQYIEQTQNPDGSWYGSWGICYTYATWFAVVGLVADGRNYHNSATLRRACEFLLSKQLPNGGWGESYLSNQNKVYTNIQGNQANLVQTSWALLALILAGQGDVDASPIHHGIKLISNSQMENGDFPQQEVTGAFMRNCTLNYSSYRNIFPIWALGEYRRRILLQ